jgi:hypothetical protein
MSNGEGVNWVMPIPSQFAQDWQWATYKCKSYSVIYNLSTCWGEVVQVAKVSINGKGIWNPVNTACSQNIS